MSQPSVPTRYVVVKVADGADVIDTETGLVAVFSDPGTARIATGMLNIGEAEFEDYSPRPYRIESVVSA